MLGRDYSISGRVVRGFGLGRKLGFPTANVNLKRLQAPIDGIFAARVTGLGSRPLAGVASVGTRPTIGGREPLLEVLIFDFDARHLRRVHHGALREASSRGAALRRSARDATPDAC